MNARHVGVVQIVALVFVLGVIGLLFYRQESNSAADLRETRRQDIAVCEGGQKLAAGQAANINQLADIALTFTHGPQERDAVEQFRVDQLANVPTFDCTNLPRP